MITGRALSESMVRKLIENGNYATNFKDAYCQFGVDFIAVSPVYKSCLTLLASVSDGPINSNCVYVRSPF